jgi:HPt (histidine-containing phosphotransfer) domain-containing protein
MNVNGGLMAAIEPLETAAWERLCELVDGDVSALLELIGVFFEEAPNMLGAMRQSLETGEAASLRRAAHSLKSNSADFGAAALARLCAELEQMAREERWDGAATLILETEQEYGRAQAALEARRQVLQARA